MNTIKQLASSQEESKDTFTLTDDLFPNTSYKLVTVSLRQVPNSPNSRRQFYLLSPMCFHCQHHVPKVVVLMWVTHDHSGLEWTCLNDCWSSRSHGTKFTLNYPILISRGDGYLSIEENCFMGNIVNTEIFSVDNFIVLYSLLISIL